MVNVVVYSSRLIIPPLFPSRCLVTLLAGSGIVTATIAIRSCRWFELDHDAADWDFLPKEDGIRSIGIFSYQPQDQEACIHYNPIFLGKGWMFATQFFAVLGPVIAFFALLANYSDKKFTTGCLMWLAAGVQAASALASMSWSGGRLWAPWLSGANANAAAGVLFLLSWMVVTFGFQSQTDYEEDEPSHEKGASLDETRSRSLPEILTDDEEGEFQDVEFGDDEDAKEHKITAEELLGTNDPIIFRAVAQGAKAILEFAKDKKADFYDTAFNN